MNDEVMGSIYCKVSDDFQRGLLPIARTVKAECYDLAVIFRGRNPDNPSDRTAGTPTEQRLEVNQEGVANCLTSVQKDSMALENKVCFINPEVAKQFTDDDMTTEKEKSVHGYRIRKLTVRECGRLMGVSDNDISKMEKVNSNSQLYKQFGNSIVCDVLCAMFRNLNIKGVKTWNEYLNETGNRDCKGGTE